MRKFLINPRSEEGFTLVELLVVIIIIGILAAIALPIFLNQQKAAFDAATKSDMKNAVTAVQTWIAKNPTKKDFVLSELKGLGNYSEGTKMNILGTPKDWCVSGTNSNGNVRGLAADDATKPQYYLFSSTNEAKIDQKLWVSSQTCSTGGLNQSLGG